MIGVYDYTMVLTYLSVVSASLGMFFAVNGRIGSAILLLGFCGVFDMFDGMVARTKKNRTDSEKAFGIQIDSLSDAIAFGILPAVIGFCLKPGFSVEKLALFLLPLTGVIRLAYYNVQETMRQKETDEGRKSYTGLPITSSAAAFPFLYLFSGILSEQAFYITYIAVAFILAALFVTPVTIPKFGKKTLMAFLGVGIVLLIVFLVLNC